MTSHEFFPGLGACDYGCHAEGYARVRRALLRFFAEHPCLSYSHLMLVHAVDENGCHAAVDSALSELVAEGWLEGFWMDATTYYAMSHPWPPDHCQAAAVAVGA